ncbi:hypothetical protein OSO01_19630 [Oceanobacillus sojae]|uniref:Uncharacterized protein n=2 Tax=Oceanobacillus sojae TaxID=582851 RepID=A0A511ZIF6_9BACI|nr:hypothetical protein OSO01_19630 [Oceanobacillus sojae]
MEFRKELDDSCYLDEEVVLYEELRNNGVAESGAKEALSSFSFKELQTVVKFVKYYKHYLMR